MKYIFLFFMFIGFLETGFAGCEEPPPDHDIEDLFSISRWAAGGAFANYAERAGFVFDNETYMNDNPYPALFHFGFKTGMDCLDIDVINHCLSVMTALNRFYVGSLEDGDEESFNRFFLEMARKLEMDQYLLPIGKETSSLEIESMDI